MTTTTPGKHHNNCASVDDNEIVSAVNPNVVAKIPTNRRTEHNFPMVLHYALSQLEREGKAHIAGFLPHGRSFRVFQPQEFVDEVLTR